jgi:hypothetical protein
MNAGISAPLLLRPEASWAQVSFLVPVNETSPTSVNNFPLWQDSVSEFPVSNEAGVTTDRLWRSRLVSAGVRAALYGQRQNTVLSPAAELGNLRHGDRVTALETGQLDFMPTGIAPGFGPGGILVVHAGLRDILSRPEHATNPGAPLPVRWFASVIKDLARPAAGQPAGIAKFLGDWGLSLYPDVEILLAVNLACPESTVRVLRPDPGTDASWDALLWWAWALARGTVPTGTMLRTPVAPATPGQIVRLPNRTAVVDRSGIAIVATAGTDSNPDISRALADFVCIFRSIYTDVFLLGYLELLVTVEVGARLDALADPAEQSREFHAIELRMRLLHSRFWRIQVTSWPWLNDILSSYQAENSLPALIAQLADNIRDFGDQIERNFQHGLNLIILLLSALGFVGVVAGVFGSVAAFMSVFGTGHWGAIVGIIGTSLGVLTLSGGAVLLLRNRAWRELAQYLRRP